MVSNKVLKRRIAMFTLSCESTTDLTLQHFNKRNIPVLPYTYTIDGVEYVDDMREGNGLALFYNQLSSGKHPTTSLINVERYTEFFRPLLEKGDLLHIAFSSTLSHSASNAMLAAEGLKKEFPNRKIYVVDSFCACVGYGILVDNIADLRDKGKNIDYLYDWAQNNKLKVHHHFFSTTLTYFRRSGRLSGPAALIGNMLKLCPIVRLDKNGKMIAYTKVMSESKAISKMLSDIETLIEDGHDYSGKLWLAHSDYISIARKVIEELKQSYPKADIRLFDIGPVVASHCGPGTLSIYFVGSQNRA